MALPLDTDDVDKSRCGFICKLPQICIKIIYLNQQFCYLPTQEKAEITIIYITSARSLTMASALTEDPLGNERRGIPGLLLYN